jgi:hypothetical protein
LFNTLRIDVRAADGGREVDARATVWTKSGGAWRVVAIFFVIIPTAKAASHLRPWNASALTDSYPLAASVPIE